MKTVTRLVAATLMLCLAGSVAGGQEWGEITTDEWQTGPPEGFPDASAVVLFDKGKAIWRLRGLEFFRHVRIKSFDSVTIPQLQNVTIDYCHYDRLRDVKARIVRSDGATIAVTDDRIQETSAGPWRTTTIRTPPLRNGDILEYAYTIDYYGGFNKLGPEKILYACMWLPGALRHGGVGRLLEVDLVDREIDQQIRPLPTWHFDHTLFTLVSELHVELGSEMDFAYYPANLPPDVSTPVHTPGPPLTGIEHYTWRLTNIKPFRMSENDASASGRRQALYFNLLSTRGSNKMMMAAFDAEYWGRMAQGFLGFLDAYRRKTGSMKKRVKQLTSGLDGQLEKAQAIHTFVAEEVTPVANKLSIIPVHYNLRGLMKAGSATPFEINVLLSEMLNSAGIVSWPVMIATRNYPGFNHTGRLNHAIVLAEIDERPVFLDACTDGCPFGTLPPECCVSQGLLISQENLSFCRIVADACERSFLLEQAD